ncbi:MAG: glycoside hydrolase family 9 protein [Spirosomataceae bacterium]
MQTINSSQRLLNKKFISSWLGFMVLFFSVGVLHAQDKTWIRVNQLGYLPHSVKVAVLVSKESPAVVSYELCDALTKQVVYTGRQVKAYGKYAAFVTTFRLNFSDFQKAGAYFVRVGKVQSPTFRIANDVYDHTADFILQYMRQQRSNYNPFLKDTCHKYDGFVVYHPDKQRDSTYIDASGGWHDASDYLQYLPTSANAVVQLLFAYQQNPSSFGDAYDAWGNKGKNGIPDILDEAKWGLDWLMKMNPGKGEYYNQIADDRDHMGMRMPNRDSTRYAPNQGLARPVYFITGQPQGAFKYKNRTVGVSSSVGKFASAFGLGSRVLAPFYPEFAKKIQQKAIDAYEFALTKPGTTQTAPCRSPYFYEEDNYVDDLELASLLVGKLDGNKTLLEAAANYAKAEPTTPWMGADTARHYQWYPFVNLGHYFGATTSTTNAKEFEAYMKLGIEKVVNRGKNNPFLNGVPFIWCSNNLAVGILTQMHLYRKLTGNQQYVEQEAAMRDWLFGCNPWGTSMICDLPEQGIAPKDPHSAFTHIGGHKISGGLVDGPIYGSIWKKLIGITLYQPDEFAEFQSDLVVYHDDYGDYSSNEPTMDGTASLSYILSALQKEGAEAIKKKFSKMR